MITLSRTVRFAVNPPTRRLEESAEKDRNGFAGVPAARGLARFYALNVRCGGEADPATGYLLDIQDVDRAVRDVIVPRISDACDRRPQVEPGELLAELLPLLDTALRGRLLSVRWIMTPYYSVEMTSAAPRVVLLRQCFDFAAAHRLHVASMSDEQNREAFGKCNNPAGHGHNYRIEPCVAVPLVDGSHQRFTLPDLERVTMAAVIDRFDHKHLDRDVEEFRGAGLTSSVENIARVSYELLAPALGAAAPGVELRSVTVWETDRTSSTYPA